jgi:hypothetical protein
MHVHIMPTHERCVLGVWVVFKATNASVHPDRKTKNVFRKRLICEWLAAPFSVSTRFFRHYERAVQGCDASFWVTLVCVLVRVAS